MSDIRPVEVALLGCGHPHSKAHLRSLVLLPESTRIHLWDPEPELAAQMAAEGAEKPLVPHRSLDNLLAADGLGWVLASLRNDVSPEALLRCAEAGQHVLSEKPLGLDRAAVAPVVAAFRQRGLTLGVCFLNRYRPLAQTIRQWVAQGLFGRLCSGETRLHTTQVRLRDPGHWLFRRELSGGGILPWLGCHYLDLLRYLMDSEAVSVSAHCATLSGEPIDVEDMAALTLRFANGVLATATFGYLMPGGNPGYMTPGYDTYFGLKGTGGEVAWEVTAATQVLHAYSRHDSWAGARTRRLELTEESGAGYGGRYGLEFYRDCLRAAQHGGEPPANGEDMLAVWSIIEGAYRSQAEGRRVDL